MQHPRPAESETLEVATSKLCSNQLSRLSWWMLSVGGHCPTGIMLWEKILLPERGNAGIELSSLSVWWVGSTTCLWSACWRAVRESSRVVLWYLLWWQSLYIKLFKMPLMLCTNSFYMSDKTELMWAILALEQRPIPVPLLFVQEILFG